MKFDQKMPYLRLDMDSDDVLEKFLNEGLDFAVTESKDKRSVQFT